MIVCLFCNVGFKCAPKPRSSKFLADPIHVTSEVISEMNSIFRRFMRS